MKPVSLIDTSTFETHMDGLIGMMSIMAVAQREELYQRAWQDIVKFVNTKDELDDDAKQEFLKDVEKRLKERVEGFLESRKDRWKES